MNKGVSGPKQIVELPCVGSQEGAKGLGASRGAHSSPRI